MGMHRTVVFLLAAVTFTHVGGAYAAPTAAQKCAALKLKAAGARAAKKLNCHAKAVLKGTAVDSDCIAKADAKFADAFAKAESDGGCIVSGDESTTAAQIDNVVSNIVAATPSVDYPIHCFDFVKNGDELGVDCGGSCAPCP